MPGAEAHRTTDQPDRATLTVLGAGTGVPAPRHSPAGHLLRTPGANILLDCGPGTVNRMAAAGVEVFDLDAVVLSHYHTDHSAELAYVLFCLGSPHRTRERPLRVHGPPGLLRVVDGMRAAWHRWIEPDPAPDVAETDAGADLEIGDVRLTPFPTVHTEVSYCWRAETPDGVLTYTGDTAECDAPARAGRDADLLLMECSLTDDMLAGDDDAKHLSPSACGRIAAAARCRHLALTHFYPVFQDTDVAEQVRAAGWDGPITLTEDGTVLTLRD